MTILKIRKEFCAETYSSCYQIELEYLFPESIASKIFSFCTKYRAGHNSNEIRLGIKGSHYYPGVLSFCYADIDRDHRDFQVRQFDLNINNYFIIDKCSTVDDILAFVRKALPSLMRECEEDDLLEVVVIPEKEIGILESLNRFRN